MVGMPIFISIYYAHISEELVYYVHISEEMIRSLPCGQDYHFSDSLHQIWSTSVVIFSYPYQRLLGSAPPHCRSPSGLSFSESSRYRLSLKTEHFSNLVGSGMGVVIHRVLCFRFLHADFILPNNFCWKPSTCVTPPITGQGSVISFLPCAECIH